ncbi:entericidin A/B family lipoprotein [Elongatibacter sediminis]|uniref:Entericidin A/B family lipoprotein n=1 Tax=Elongatibacter sediminis TaxID=3119006 RepID=A0AAW9RB31_9GAMM
MNRIIALIALLLSMMLNVTACNTTRGVGQDIEAAGDAIEDAADEAEEEIED